LSNIIVGLDIGTSCIRCVIGQVDEDNRLQVIGASKKPSRGLQKGVVVNIDATVAAIKEALDEAEQAADVDVVSVYTAIGGAQVEGRTSSNGVAVDATKRNRRLEITEKTRNNAIESSIIFVHPEGKKLLHVIPQEYKIDEIPGYKDPVGILGVRLDVSVYIVTAFITACSNLEMCLNRAGLVLDDIMLKTLAATVATLHKEEMELGSILIDIGCDSTDVMVINNDAPIYITSIPLGGSSVTSDIAQVKGIPKDIAEELKINSGCCWLEGGEKDEEVIIREIGARPAEQTTKYELCEIIQPRMEEIMTMVRKEVIHHAGLKKLEGSIVLTGGGALMPGIRQLTQAVWRTESVRLGECPDMGRVPGENGYMYRSSDFATAMGLIMSAKSSANKDRGRKKVHPVKEKNPGGFADKVKGIWKKFF
jgi:cell division protein FtsA